MEQQRKLYIALAIYAVLGLLIWTTIDEIPLQVSGLPAALQGAHLTLRRVTLAVLGLFCLRTVLHGWAVKVRAERESRES